MATKILEVQHKSASLEMSHDFLVMKNEAVHKSNFLNGLLIIMDNSRHLNLIEKKAYTQFIFFLFTRIVSLFSLRHYSSLVLTARR